MISSEVKLAMCLIGLFMVLSPLACILALSYLDEDINPKP